MAMPRRIPVDFHVAFPNGGYLVSEVVPVNDFERSTADTKVQQVDAESGLPLWQVEMVDADPEAKKATRTVLVKFAAKQQPVPPANDSGGPFTPVLLEKLVAVPYIEDVTETFSRIAWSYRAGSMTSPNGHSKPSKPTGSDAKAVA